MEAAAVEADETLCNEATDRTSGLTQDRKGKTMDTAESAGIRTQTLENEPSVEAGSKTEAKTIVKILAIVIPLLSFLVLNWITIAAVLLVGKIHPVEIATMAGHLIGVYLMPTIIMLLFQIGRQFRNPRSRWTIFMNTGIFFLVVNILSAIGKVLTKL
jgi:phosphatidylglycerophosphate synthase